MKTDEGLGSDNTHFKVPTSVACDRQGRVYVSDCMNDRIQVFSPAGKFLKSIATAKPARVEVSPTSGEIWVFSWPVIGMSNKLLKETGFEWNKVRPTLTRYGSLDNPQRISSQPLPFDINLTGFFLTGPIASAAVDWWADRPTLWLIGGASTTSRGSTWPGAALAPTPTATATRG